MGVKKGGIMQPTTEFRKNKRKWTEKRNSPQFSKFDKKYKLINPRIQTSRNIKIKFLKTSDRRKS